MAKGIIVRKGTGGGKLFAAIAVTYPEGSECICTKGSKTLRASGDSRKWIFAIPEEGEWNVTSTDKEDPKKTKSQIVNITDEGQTESVTLSYELVLFDKGSIVDWTSVVKISGNDSCSIGSVITCSIKGGVGLSETGVLAYTRNNLPLAGYSALKVRFTALSGRNAYIGVADMSSPSSKGTYGSWAENKACAVSNFSGGGVAELNIKGCSGQSLAVVLGFSSAKNETASSCSVDKVWLE